MAFRLGFNSKQVLFGYLVVKSNGDIKIVVSPNPRTYRYIDGSVRPNPLIYPMGNYLKVGNVVSVNNLRRLVELQVPNGAYIVTGAVISARNSPDLYADLCVVFVVNTNRDTKICMPDASINNIYPRYDRDGEEVYNCMKIYSTLEYNPDDNYEDRDLFRLYDNQKGYKNWWISGTTPTGEKIYGSRFVNFKQLKCSECIEELNLMKNQIRHNEFSNIDYSCVGIYVPKNTSLIMVDLFQNLKRPGDKVHERTLFQEGSVIILENIELRFLMERFNPKEDPSTSTEIGLDFVNPFYVLQPVTELCQGQPSLTAWSLRITTKIEDNRHIAVLVVPEGGAFTRVYGFNLGVNDVIGRKIGANVYPKPWDKYLVAPEAGVEEELGEDPYPDYKSDDLIDEDWT